MNTSAVKNDTLSTNIFNYHRYFYYSYKLELTIKNQQRKIHKSKILIVPCTVFIFV